MEHAIPGDDSGGMSSWGSPPGSVMPPPVPIPLSSYSLVACSKFLMQFGIWTVAFLALYFVGLHASNDTTRRRMQRVSFNE